MEQPHNKFCLHDARKHARIKVLVPCGIKVAHQSPSDAWGHIHDLSIGGVEIHTYFHLEKGQTVFITFSIDDTFQFTNVKGTIVRVRDDDGYIFAGFSFDEIVDKNHLRDALQSLLEKG